MNIAKKLLRKQIREAERRLDEQYIKAAGSYICRKLLSLPEYASASAVFCFVSMPGELPTELFLRQALSDGKRVCVPVCTGPGIMVPKQIFSLSDLSPGFWDIPEPGPEAPSVLPSDISLAVIPCLSCSMSGDRLGRGGGYYDRFLASYSGSAVMVCLDRLVSETIPTEPHDIRVPHVLTEERSSF